MRAESFSAINLKAAVHRRVAEAQRIDMIEDYEPPTMSTRLTYGVSLNAASIRVWPFVFSAPSRLCGSSIAVFWDHWEGEAPAEP